MKFSKDQVVQSKFDFTIIDEVDSILIDESRTPLIISGAAEESSSLYKVVDKIVSNLAKNDYEKNEKSRTVVLNDPAVEKLEKFSLKINYYKVEACMMSTMSPCYTIPTSH